MLLYLKRIIGVNRCTNEIIDFSSEVDINWHAVQTLTKWYFSFKHSLIKYVGRAEAHVAYVLYMV